jgi:DNA (cytosine-5)-methyltransferase 1
MNHLAVIEEYLGTETGEAQSPHAKAAGRFYTHELIGKHLVAGWLTHARSWLSRTPRAAIADPFCGDGRLVLWAMEAACARYPRIKRWDVHLWDVDREALRVAEGSVRALAKRLDIEAVVFPRSVDSFRLAVEHENSIDLVITNPPWELLKPDVRELRALPEIARSKYVAALRSFDEFLINTYPASQPKRKFAGWGTNLARAGTELAVRLVKDGGFAAIVSPASLFADENSVALRRWLFVHNTLVNAAYFPAELRLFGNADVTAASLLLRRKRNDAPRFGIDTYRSVSGDKTTHAMSFSSTHEFELQNCVIPISFGLGVTDIIGRFQHLDCIGDLEGASSTSLWAGREVDETKISTWFAKRGGAPFLKGRMIGRFCVQEQPTDLLRKERFATLPSVKFARIAWRDVARPNQKRRAIATIIPAGWVAGNSLGVAYFKDDDVQRLRVLLGVINSLPFELQLRTRLATGHVSLSALRTVRLPSLDDSPITRLIAKYVRKALAGVDGAIPMIEGAAAHAYGLTEAELERIMSEFAKIDDRERAAIVDGYRVVASEIESKDSVREGPPVEIPNHYSAKLSELDLQTALAIPPGGNWKNVPASIPLKRLQTIRESFARGEGSRSTYYGRLRPDRPSYTISTYFSRPGNGCHLHYDYSGGQHRVISQREAARLQTFPDRFTFYGSKTSINQQIGNAIPPLLAYRIAQQLDGPGCFVDLFSGAGGFGLGFSWAGWVPLVANEIEPNFLRTYTSNVHADAIQGDIRADDVIQQIVRTTKERRRSHPGLPLWVLGGPPCQGFSTAGKRRSLDDDRNHLFKNYIRILELLKPDGFVFENVTGLLNMEGGEVFRGISDELRKCAVGFGHWILAAEEHGVPQRRTRVILIGMRKKSNIPSPPPAITGAPDKHDLFDQATPWVTTSEALGDLPPLKNAQDGSHMAYATPPTNVFQALMRGLLKPEDYLGKLRSGLRAY